MKKIISLIIIALILVGCSQEEIVDENVVIINTDEGGYDYVYPIVSTYSRFFHTGKDYKEIGKGLVDISKDTFETQKYDLKEGTILTDYANDFQPLVHLRESTDNPYGLNPQRDTQIQVNDVTMVTGPLLVNDIYEINFVDKENDDEIAGISVAIVLNKTINGDNGLPVEVDDDILYNFGTEIAGPKLESYLRKKPALVNIPIVIAIYTIDHGNDSFPGNYVAKAEYQSRQGKYVAINHQYSIFPSSRGQNKDGLLNNKINNMKEAVNAILPEDIGLVAYGEFRDEQLVSLKIDVNFQSKTYTEVSAISQYLAQLLLENDISAHTIIEIKALNKTIAIIVKGANAKSIEIIEM